MNEQFAHSLTSRCLLKEMKPPRYFCPSISGDVVNLATLDAERVAGVGNGELIELFGLIELSVMTRS